MHPASCDTGSHAREEVCVRVALVLACLSISAASAAIVTSLAKGCIVNGPGEMADADFGYVGSGVGKAPQRAVRRGHMRGGHWHLPTFALTCNGRLCSVVRGALEVDLYVGYDCVQRAIPSEKAVDRLSTR